MNQHTKGPWEAWFGEPDAEGYLGDAGIDTAGRQAGIVEIKVLSETLLCESSVEEWNATMRADANLIAAAPEMLEIVSALNEWFNESGIGSPGPSGSSVVCSDNRTLAEHVLAVMRKVKGGA